MNRPISPQQLDKILESKPRSSGSRIIWTLPAIGQRIGVGPDFVRDTLAKQEGTPIKQIGGRYFAFEDDLILFLRR
ncbi:hypothetical protein OE766_05370 [Pararhizobium sp. YC-54]|uniref:hypothetical protein n=1 Tax=Pararhizobium sp. YC-54 TaxID=2986920 RepID=UPI0021F6C449|nr:hypothetical protein [Pararhizobium sp. YC-54]MCV9997669.1 hypothetical protein [Pararhizobium sp. YC-54]